MKTSLFNAALFVFGNLFIMFCGVLDAVRGTKHPRISDHDRFADRGVYSEDSSVDPLA